MYVVDTDVSIDYLKGVDKAVALIDSIEELYITTITAAELFYGAYNSQNPDKLLPPLKNYLQRFRDIPFQVWDSILFGKIKSALKKKGTPIDDANIMNASIALSYDFTIITRNVKHFQNISGLKILEP
ncbi:type II toxin-antitoxin system VapC family toxin [Candidatus Woesearchaeota archaeon]|nr:type II toxin-antitoxin system VapC family toxin [Candidatus Woesearchaeota archaeon]